MTSLDTYKTLTARATRRRRCDRCRREVVEIDGQWLVAHTIVARTVIPAEGPLQRELCGDLHMLTCDDGYIPEDEGGGDAS